MALAPVPIGPPKPDFWGAKMAFQKLSTIGPMAAESPGWPDPQQVVVGRNCP